MVASAATVVLYFADSGGPSEGDGVQDRVVAKRRATVTPIVSRETQGVWFSLDF